MSLVDAVCEELPRLGPDVRVHRIRLRVGRLSGVVVSALTFAYQVAAAESAIADVPLAIEESAGRELEIVGLEVVDDADRGSSPQHPQTQ
jgi:Zn finger protein HypA/HybF involved in hydrogenase expression